MVARGLSPDRYRETLSLTGFLGILRIPHYITFSYGRTTMRRITSFVRKRLRARAGLAAVVTGAAFLLIGGAAGAAVQATASSTPPPLTRACVTGPDRSLDDGFENASSFDNCKKTGGFAVSLPAGISIAGATVNSAGDLIISLSNGKSIDAGHVKGDAVSGLAGAYYSLAKYNVGDTNGGAVATVACKSDTDVAISGGVQTLALGTNGLAGNVPVSNSFPGRMDWSTNTPKLNSDGTPDLSGWIVQFGGNSSTTSLGDPKYVNIYALCVPGADIPVDTTYSESGASQARTSADWGDIKKPVKAGLTADWGDADWGDGTHA